jgi:EAL domain-containing protein (putative c-di-GMP-specific phosphodiesterase class I)
MDLEEGDQSSAGVVRGMISLSHELRKTVVAEGIETETQARMLRESGCDFAQGYYYMKPMDRTALLQSRRDAKAAETGPHALSEPVEP